MRHPPRTIIVSLAILVLLVITTQLWWQDWGAVLGKKLWQEPQTTATGGLAWLRDRINYFSKLDRLVESQLDLSLENRQLREQLQRIIQLEKENVFLRAELGIAQRYNYNLELARILQISLAGPFRTATINKGQQAGVRAGQPVIFQGNILVGIVKEVYPDSALVYLVNDPRLTLSAKLADSIVAGRTHGALNQGVALELVTNQEVVTTGSQVVTNGLDGLPVGLIIGEVSSATLAGGELFQAINIDPYYLRYLLEQVFVLK